MKDKAYKVVKKDAERSVENTYLYTTCYASAENKVEILAKKGIEAEIIEA